MVERGQHARPRRWVRTLRPRSLSLRWWLAALFAAVAAITAVTIVAVLGNRSEGAFRESAQDVAAGKTFAAAAVLADATTASAFRRGVAEEAERRGLAMFAFDSTGRLVTSSVSQGIPLADVPVHEALPSVLLGRRVVQSTRDGARTLVGVPLRRGPAAALITYAHRPELSTQLGIVRDETIVAAAWATLLGAVAGLLAATLITARLRRIAGAAAAIESGDFDEPLRPTFPDELGALAASIDRMRKRLRAMFARIASDRDRLDRLLARLREGVIAVRPDGRVEFANEAARAILGAPELQPGDALPEPWSDTSLVALAGRLYQPAAGAVTVEVAPDDDRLYLVTGVPAVGDETAVLVVNDLSERARNERAQRDFVTNAAHELRTPVAAIASSVEMLRSGASDDPDERETFLAFIDGEAARLTRLARALLVLARAEALAGEVPDLVPVPVRPLLDAVAASLRPAPGVRVHVSCADDVVALADADLLEQAVSSVAANAAKFTERGEIRLGAAARGDARVAVEVSDTGAGISALDESRVFERFFRGADRNRDGFGLGLSIARQAVRVLGGELEVRSRNGGGTTATLVLAAVARGDR